ncbi:MAG TPA: S41 family peptidase [Pirellulales bacterium]|nr:S41 family peptidase [Pirellulales bacterium]
MPAARPARSTLFFVATLFAGLLSLPLLAEEKPAATKADAPKPAAANKKDAHAKEALKDEDYEMYKSFADTVDQIERNYVKNISRRELMDAAIKGMLSKLDPYSSYIPPEDLSGFKTAVESQFGGIGIQIAIDRGHIKVLSPMMDTPAYRAGIRAGDRIVKIEGHPAEGLTIDDAVKRLKGDVGTAVTLSFLHPDSDKPETVTLKREVIQVDTVLGDRRGDDDHWNFMLDDAKKIGYIRITAFSHDTTRDLKRALEKLKSEGFKALILDLRNNPGGLLTSAVDICDLFVREGVIVSTEGRNSPKKVWEAHQVPKYDNFPMAVLVNRYSASASEIVSACLQDHDRAVIIGERTWGKGSVQNVIELEDGKSALKLTTAGYLRPNGHNIHRYPDAKESDEWGVKPNPGFEVRFSDAELARMMLDRRERDFVLAHKKPADKEDKPSAEKGSPDKAGADKPADEKPAGDVKASKEAAGDEEADPEHKDAFVDRQLQKALEYITKELAK